MIKKLRNKFISISMLSVIIVLSIIVLVMNIWNYIKMNESIDEILNVLSCNGGYFPKSLVEENLPTENIPNENMPAVNNNIKKQDKNDFRFGKETPFATRFFTVNLDENGNVIFTNTKDVATITTTDANEYARQIYNSNKSIGFIDNYKYEITQTSEGYLIVAIDSTKDLKTFESFLVTSIIVMIIGIISVFFVILIFSKKAIKPIIESYEKQKRFITDASHEIKTPLTIIDTCTEMIEIEENKKTEWTESIKKQIKRLNYLVSNLIMLSKMDEETVKIVKTEFSLSDAVIETTENYKSIIKAKGKKLEQSIEKNISYVGNEQNIRKILDILLDNAIKYSNENGNIEISLKTQGKNKILKVINSVDEIQKGNLNVLFDRFYRIDNSRNTKTGGYGIGLSIAKAIAEVHKAEITAFSSEGKSIEFKIVF